MEKQISDYQESIIQKIKLLRNERKISQLGLSCILGISGGQVGNIENPRFQHKYTLKQIYSFCEHINYPFERIFLTTEETLKPDKNEILIKKIIEYENE